MRTDRIPKDEILQGQCCLSERQALLAPPKVGGMALDEDSWCVLWIDKLKPIEWTRVLWDDLDIDRARKETIESLVNHHDSSEHEEFAKGLGLIFFLRGPPGTGKTLTVGKSSIVTLHS